MSDDQEVTIGEVYRLCQRIDTKVEAQNGRVNALEKDVARIKTLWAAGSAIVVFLGDTIKHKVFG